MSHHPRPSILPEHLSAPCAKHRKPGSIGGGLLACILAVLPLPAFGQMATASNGKFVGNLIKSTTTVDPDFDTYWNQVTPENSGKWSSVEGTRDVMNWTQLDFAYNYSRSRGIPFRLHTLIWGQQYPTWMDSLPANEQREEVEEWIAALAARYPNVEYIDVVNEPLPGHAPAPFRNALGGAGTTGWDWVIWSFEKAREYFPNAKLHINDYNIINNDSATTQYLTIINLLNARGLIDGIGEQAHFYESTSLTTLQNNLNRLAATGLPIYITELDVNIANDTNQSNRYQQLFPLFWTNPSVRGITFWGYKQGQIWRTDGFLLRSDGTERPALTWLKNYIAANPQSFNASVASPANGQGLSNVSPVSATATVTYGSAPFTVTFQRKLDSETEYTTVSSDNTAPYTAELGNLPLGTYQLRVVVTDAETRTTTSPANTFTVFPATGGTWLGTSGNWDEPSIWTDGTIANAIGSTASFTGVNITADQTITLNGSRTIGNIVFTDATTPSHNLTISGANTLTLDVSSGAPVINVTQADRRLTISSVVAGNDGLQKAGAGALTLSGNNIYTGNTTIQGGTLRLEGNAFSTTARNYSINSGAVLHQAGSSQIPSGTTTISGTGTLRGSFSNGIGTGRTLNLSLGAGGLIDIPSGTGIYNGGWQAINWSNNQATLNVAGTLNIVDGQAITAAALTGAGTIDSTVSGGTAANFILGAANGSGIFSGNITAAGTRLISLVKSGTGTQTFSGSTTFRGTTTINGGALHFTRANSLYAGVITDWVKTKINVNNGCTIAFNVGGTNEFTSENITTLLSGLGGAVNNNGLRAGSTVALDTTNATGGTFTISDVIANTTGTGGGAVGLRKIGTNTLMLTNNHTYTGPTNVDDGTLSVTGSLGATAVRVNGGILTGNGNFGGNVTIGAGAMHSLAVAPTPAAQDTSVITGILAMAESTLTLTPTTPPAPGVYVLATATAAITGFPLFINTNGISGTVSVDTASTPKRLLLTVSGTPYAVWTQQTFTNPFTLTALTDNPDGDSLNNLQEFAFGTDPTIGGQSISYTPGGAVASGGLPVAMNLAVGEESDFRAIFTRRKDHIAAGLTYTVQFSADLAFWVTSNATPTLLSGDGTANPGSIEAVSVPYPLLITTPNGEEKPKFFRLAVSNN
jgi:endo-1,4-beta-xylanase